MCALRILSKVVGYTAILLRLLPLPFILFGGCSRRWLSLLYFEYFTFPDLNTTLNVAKLYKSGFFSLHL